MRLRTLWTLIVLAAATAVPPVAFSQAKPRKAEEKPKTAPVVESHTTAAVKYVSLNRRDPFLNPLTIKRKEAPVDEELDRGTPPPGIAGMFVAQVAFVGVSSRDDGKTAVFRGTDRRVYFLQEGDKFFDGYLRTIKPDSVVILRQRYFRSGKTQSDEVIKRLRMP
jgi:hypothetical protein